MSKTIFSKSEECKKSVKEVSTLVKIRKIICYLQLIMSKRRIYIYVSLVLFIFFSWMFFDSDKKQETFSETLKIALREVGNQLLLTNQDSTSIILPVVALNEFKYKLRFKQDLSFEPNQLVTIVDNAFTKSKLSKSYLIEVIQCTDKEVAYSYQMSAKEENTIIPCAGRYLPNACYELEVRFIKKRNSFYNKQMVLYFLIVLVLIALLDYFFSKRKQIVEQDVNNEVYMSIGSFRFYQEQNKLVKAATEINLSKKECELLTIFVAQPNQIIKRDELTKRVWEDNGVFVGRSLDTYISKLRKKLKDDDTIKLTNIHGVGYKLEIN